MKKATNHRSAIAALAEFALECWKSVSGTT